MKTYIRTSPLLILVISLLCVSTLFAQKKGEREKDFDKKLEQMDRLFESKEKNNAQRMESLLDKMNKQFSDLLEKSWADINKKEAIDWKDKPKPKTIPTYRKPIQKVSILPIEAIDRTSPTPKIKRALPNIAITDLKSEDEDIEDEVSESAEIKINFYGDTFLLTVEKATQELKTKFRTKSDISVFWNSFTQTRYTKNVLALRKFADDKKLNDWAYFKLVENTANTLFKKNKDTATLWTWAIMNQSGYKVKIGMSGKKIHLMLPIQETVYRTSYFPFEGYNYYVFSKNASPKNMQTYEQNFPGAKSIISMSYAHAINIEGETIVKKIKIPNHDKEIYIPISKGAIDYFKDCPQVSLDVYFSYPPQKKIFDALKLQLEPYLKQKQSKKEKAAFLLSFVQHGLEYKTDQDQFGYEKKMYPEEFFFYPANDCDDRSVIYSLLVNEMLGLATVGLRYPGHLATGVKFDGGVKGLSVKFKGDYFTICDPTYINSGIGEVMPDFIGVSPKIVYKKERKL